MNVKIKPFGWPPGIEFTPRKGTPLIMVHHSKSEDVSAKIINGWHLQRKTNGIPWKGIGYNYVIRTNGDIEEGRPHWAQGAHCYGKNGVSVGICLTGNFNEHKPTKEQMSSLAELIFYLQDIYPDAKPAAHRDFVATDCPGKLFPWDKLINQLEEKSMSKFKDLDKCMYPELALEAVKEGLVGGFPDGTLRPEASLSREQGWLIDLRQQRVLGQAHNIPKMVDQFMPSIVRIWSNGTVGSGSFVAPNYILTNSHVTNGQKEVTIDTDTRQQVKGKVIKDAGGHAGDGLDLALIETEFTGPPLVLGDKIVHGEFCLALGMPAGEWQSVSAGIVTRYGGDFLQVDALVNPGNSGGAIINSSGQLIGVPTWKFVAQGFDNHNYDIVVGKVKEFIKGVI